MSDKIKPLKFNTLNKGTVCSVVTLFTTEKERMPAVITAVGEDHCLVRLLRSDIEKELCVKSDNIYPRLTKQEVWLNLELQNIRRVLYEVTDISLQLSTTQLLYDQGLRFVEVDHVKDND